MAVRRKCLTKRSRTENILQGGSGKDEEETTWAEIRQLRSAKIRQLEGIEALRSVTVLGRATLMLKAACWIFYCRTFGLHYSRRQYKACPSQKKPELLKPRANVVGSTDLAKQLLEKQREKAAAHTRAFYAQHHDGVFVAFKMTRTRVPDPKQYVGVKFKKLFENAEWWDGVVSEYHDDVQRWRVTHQDGDMEDFTVASMQQHL